MARDRFGEKPLFYTERSGYLQFASEISALRTGLSSEPAIDPVSFEMYLALGYVPGERTVFEGIRQLAPASSLAWSVQRPHARTAVYWRPPPVPVAARARPVEFADEARALLESAVASRLVADVPVGVFLSGGLDSSIVAAMAAAQSPAGIKTFTVCYDSGEFNEALQARETAALINSEHHEVFLPRAEVASLFARVVGRLDQPIADPALVALNYVAAAARENVTVALGGEGADEVFGGYPRYRWMARAERLQRLMPAAVGRAAAAAARTARGRAGRLAEVFEPASLVERHLEWVGALNRAERARLYGPRLGETLSADYVLDDLTAVLTGEDRSTTASALMRLDQRRYLPDDVLTKADRATMQVSLEMRTPYLERTLVELAATIPAATHLRANGKSVLREIAATLPQIGRASRAKTAFRVPVSDWLRGPLHDALLDQVHEGPLATEGWLEPQAMHQLAQEHLQGVADHGRQLWPILVAGVWLDGLRRGGAGSLESRVRE
jgi:asparagine synthase (glutamine-hydrolysing)